MALEKDLLTIIDGLDRRLRALERHPQAPSISYTTTQNQTISSLQAANTPGDIAYVYFTLSSPDGLVVQGEPIIEPLYYDGITTTRYPSGSSWATYDIR